ncbi:hypothetical protein RHODOSMS8_00797 [Rhodobiaceae bacterium]|nr:hypothetical protein RHODOSMS8_00797 [Rhodobiaceae bacterium]
MQDVKREIRRFLSSPVPEVLEIRGRWGVGKTYLWNREIESASCRSDIALNRYSYVSLYGLNDLDQVKQSIFDNRQKSDQLGQPASLDTLVENSKEILKQLRPASRAKRILDLVSLVPGLQSISGLADVTRSYFYFLISEQLICFDDLERASSKFDVEDLMGLISQLKEQKQCKIVLILNDEPLEGEQGDFDGTAEKVVDISLLFKRSARDCAQIALSSEGHLTEWLTGFFDELGIDNLRLMRRVERILLTIKGSMDRYDPSIFEQLCKVTTLFMWSKYGKQETPSKEYILKVMAPFSGYRSGEQELSSKESSWKELITKYQFYPFSDLDRVAIDAVDNGYFQMNLLCDQAQRKQNEIDKKQSREAFYDVWKSLDDSFDGTPEQFVGDMTQAFKLNALALSPRDLNQTVQICKQLGFENEVDALIKTFVDTHAEDDEVFDLDRSPYRNDLSEVEVRMAFEKKMGGVVVKQDMAGVLLRIVEQSGWNPSDIEFLASKSVEEYEALFRELKGSDKRAVIGRCLDFERFTDAPDELQEISKKSKLALRAISKDSEFAEFKVRRLGIELD